MLHQQIFTQEKPVYLDCHMGTAQSTPEMQQLIKKLAEEYQLGISGYFGEQLFHLFNIKPENKSKVLIEEVSKMKNGEIYYAFFHIGKDTPEMQALEDMNMKADGKFFSVTKHRQAELEALKSTDFSEAIEKNNIRLMNYRMLINDLGLKNLQPVKK